MAVSKNNGTPNHKFDRVFHHFHPSILGENPLFLVQHPICCKNVTASGLNLVTNPTSFGMFPTMNERSQHPPEGPARFLSPGNTE